MLQRPAAVLRAPAALQQTFCRSSARASSTAASRRCKSSTACLGSGGFALFLLECRRLRPFARAFLFSSFACADLFRYVRLRMRRNGGSAAMLGRQFLCESSCCESVSNVDLLPLTPILCNPCRVSTISYRGAMCLTTLNQSLCDKSSIADAR